MSHTTPLSPHPPAATISLLNLPTSSSRSGGDSSSDDDSPHSGRGGTSEIHRSLMSIPTNLPVRRQSVSIQIDRTIDPAKRRTIIGQGGALSSHGRYTPCVNSCRCMNITLSVSNDPPLSEGERQAVESLFGNAASSSSHQQQQHSHHDAASTAILNTSPQSASSSSSSSNSIFPDGYFTGRPISKSSQLDTLVHTRPHPSQNQWMIKRCLNCHQDTYAISTVHSIIVVNQKAYYGDELRKWRETELFSKYFNILIRNTHASTGIVGAGGSPNSISSDAPAIQASPAIQHQLRSTLDQFLENERISMETRLSQFRAQEESKFAGLENQLRSQYQSVLAQVEHEHQGNGVLVGEVITSNTGGTGVSPRGYDPYSSAARRNSSPRLRQPHVGGQHGKLTTAELQMYPNPVLVGDDEATSTNAAAGISSPGVRSDRGSISPISGLPLTRARDNSFTGLGAGIVSGPGRKSLTPPLASSSLEERAALLAEHKSAVATIAVPLDATSVLAIPPERRISNTSATSAASSYTRSPLVPKHPSLLNAPAPRSRPTSTSESPVRLAQPIATHPNSVIGTSPNANATSAASSNANAASMSESKVSDLLNGSGGDMTNGGISLVPFDEESSPSPLLFDPALSQFDEFILPVPSVGDMLYSSRRSDAEHEAMFDLEEEAEAKAKAELEASPIMRGESGPREEMIVSEDEEEEEEEEDISEAEEEPIPEPEPVASTQISSKAAKLLGMTSGGNLPTSASGSKITTTPFTQHAIIRPRTASGTNGGVRMVQMSLPIAIPVQLRASSSGVEESKTTTAVGKTPRVESGLGASLRQNAMVGSVKPSTTTTTTTTTTSTTSNSSRGFDASRNRVESFASYSSDEEDSDSKSSSTAGVGDAGFVPPHTLVAEPYFSFAKVRHLDSYKNQPSMSSSVMKVQHFPRGDAASSSTTTSFTSVASPFASSVKFEPPMSSSVPRISGSLGARILAQQKQQQQASPAKAGSNTTTASSTSSSSSSATPSTGFVANARLGFQANNNANAPKPAATAATRGLQPSSRNPGATTTTTNPTK